MQIEEIWHDEKSCKNNLLNFANWFCIFNFQFFIFKRYCNAFVVDFSPKGLKILVFDICLSAIHANWENWTWWIAGLMNRAAICWLFKMILHLQLIVMIYIFLAAVTALNKLFFLHFVIDYALARGRQLKSSRAWQQYWFQQMLCIVDFSPRGMKIRSFSKFQ